MILVKLFILAIFMNLPLVILINLFLNLLIVAKQGILKNSVCLMILPILYKLGKYSDYGKYCECGDFDDSGESC